MSRGIFTERDKKPSDEEVFASLAQSRDLWEETVRFIEDHYRTKKTYKFYGRNYGWALQFSKFGKALVSLYPAEGEFVAQVILNRVQCEEVMKSGIGAEMRKLIILTPEIHEGRWIFARVKTSDDVKDIKTLISVRASV